MSYVRMVGVLLLKWAWDGNVAMLERIGQYKRLCIGSGYMGVKGYVFNDLMIFHEH
jgi:hypothetical protein